MYHPRTRTSNPVKILKLHKIYRIVGCGCESLSRYHVSPTTDCLGKHLPSDEGRKFTFDLDFEAFSGTVGMNRDAVDQSAKTGDE
jgi:hypothetical protein